MPGITITKTLVKGEYYTTITTEGLNMYEVVGMLEHYYKYYSEHALKRHFESDAKIEKRRQNATKTEKPGGKVSRNRKGLRPGKN